MNRSTGTGFIGFGLVLIVIGAILKFAITADADGFNIETVGLIAIWAGAVSLVIGILLMVLGGRRHSSVRENVVQTSSGTERTQERDDFNSPL
jgi:hypothetical protein